MLFFFSYARADYTPFLHRFYGDLREAVRSKVGGPNDDTIAFRDAASIEPGRPWPDAIVQALRICKVFVFLHSPTYYTRDGCGKEFSVIKQRIATSNGSSPEFSQVSSIQPIFWDGDKQLTNVPPEVAAIQLTHEDYGDEYGRQGMLQIIRASAGSTIYWEAINAMARRIALASRDTPLPELRESLRWDAIEPLFPIASPLVPSFLLTANTHVTGSNPIRSPRYARFVWIVGKRDELTPTRSLEYLESYDPDGIEEEWRPFLPDTIDPARLIATDAARDVRLAYRCETLPRNQQELESLIAQAGDAYTPVVVVADLWSLCLHKYSALVKLFDRGKLDNCAVLFPWNFNDNQTKRDHHMLRRRLAEVFPLQFYKPETLLLFEGISDAQTFKAELSKLLTRYIADINRSMKAARELPRDSAFNAPPMLGSASASS
jgi:FxsC-like protein